MTDIILKQGTGVPSDSDLEVAEVAIDSSSGAMYTKLADGSVKHLNSNGGGFVDAPNDGQLYGRQSEAWAVVPTGGGGGGIEEAPKTGKMYARKDAAWEEFATGNLDDGNQDGEILTWDTATANWTHDETMLVSNNTVDLAAGSTVNTKALNAVAFTVERGLNTAGRNAVTVKNPGANDPSSAYMQCIDQNNNVDFTITSQGNVGIGTDSPSGKLSVSDNGANGIEITPNSSRWGNMILSWDRVAGNSSPLSYRADSHKFYTTSDENDPKLTIDATGNVGIGVDAPSQKLHVAGQAFIKATGSADYVMRLEGAKGNPQLELAPFAADFSSNIYAGLSGTADTFLNLICNKSFAVCTGTQDKSGGSNKRFTIDQAGDATFSGMVRAGNPVSSSDGSRLNPAGAVQVYRATANSSDDVFMGNGAGNITSRIRSNGDATFSGTVNADKFIGDGSGLTGVGVSGNFVDKDTTTAQTMKSNLTAPNFIATSDERLKDNITTAPVGLIDSLKGREWDWKESGEKGSGVIAQELEEVLPHLVHTDDEGMKSVSYMGLCAYLIEEVKALRAEVEALKS